jgi:phosphoribosylformimino-5-aminoimidazole carboxamide ribotide isomerase
MIIIPAVDLKNGKCVRLLQGRMDQETVFSDDPAAMALRWEREGAEMLHVVDLDGAIAKSPRNLAAIREIRARLQIPMEVGGGIRTLDTIRRYVEMGVDKVVIGTEAIRNPDLVKAACEAFPGRVVIGIDAKSGRVAIEGWTETTGTLAVDLARQFEGCGVAAINFTDIQRDGMQTGVNLEATRQLAEALSIPVVASGGVSTLEDIRALLPLADAGVTGVIVGRALYAGSLDLPAAIRLLRGGQKP